MALFGQDTVAVFGDMTHEGNILSMPGSVLNFYGLRWRNNTGASILDESNDGLSGTGGWFQFIQPGRSNPGVVYQYVSGGFNVTQNAGTIFPNLRVFNSPGLVLDDLNDLKISHELDLRKGSIFLNGWNLVVGHHTPGIITNYSDSNFIITGGRFGSGFLYRSNIQPANGLIVFPVGTRPDSYTPAVVSMQSGTSTVRTAVSDSVLAQLTQGRNLFGTTVNKTWQIDPLTTNTQMGITLVHKLSDEGPDFEANRNSSYVAYFNGSNWDTSRTRSAPVSPSTYTTSAPDADAAFNTRSFQLQGNSAFFTSMVAEILNSPSKTTLQFFDAFRNDIASDSITLRWATSREYFLRGFSIERKLLDAANFDSVGFVVTKSPNGISYVSVGYDSLDIQDTEQSLLYRLKVIMTDGSFFYSPIRLVKGKFVDGQIRVWPNPVRAGTVLHVYYSGALHIKAMALIDVPGRRAGYTAFPQPLQNRNYYEINVPSGLSAGTYFLQFIGEDSQIIHVEKVIIINRL
ncbi:hypothetical protein [Chitinophaga sp. sic0106]|uniref:hypothetical protein n=1 Tax=Chitinophaga sp. sic0106 TaxID=2854785 RepID=UPI001C45FBB9|nr:hypothetical protein [Chitinophaga sp. sic0106]MBV7533858.1 hypothetical protein [Chitinophaga sp. sic0106]